MRADKLLDPLDKEAPETNLWFRRRTNNLCICDDEQLTTVLAENLVALVREALDQRPCALITTSAGRTLRPTYALLRARYTLAVDWNRVICVQMDEYEGLSHEDPRSLAWDVTREFVDPLGIGQFIRFYAANGSPSCQLDAYERQ